MTEPYGTERSVDQQEATRETVIAPHHSSLPDTTNLAIVRSTIASLPPREGDSLGPYTLLVRLGAGSYGEVWKAEQKEPVRRFVAIKILNAGMNSTAVVARFRAEQQALAMMDHPGIAKVFDAGLAPSGLPYFVMQYVEGGTLLAYCDGERLPLRKRLELFAQVCDAVHHAHQKGIIHRDLKPSNIMVTTTGDGAHQPIVVDFGVAKAVSGPLTEESLYSIVGRPQGTWAYMSPEQAEGLADVDTRSDVYSLGIVLYELLAGVRPFDDDTFRQAGEDAKRRRIRETPAPSPGVLLATDHTATASQAALARGTTQRELSQLLSGELSWIPLYAIRKERQRRYDSASLLAADVRNFLEGRPLIAAPESARYRLSKFVARNRLQVIAAMTIVASLIAGLAATLWQARRADDRAIAAERAEQAEKERADQLQRVSDFQREMIAQLDPQAAGLALMSDVRDRLAAALERSGVNDDERRQRVEAFAGELSNVNATDAAAAMIDRTILTPAIRAVDERFASQPEVDAQLRQALADVYRDIGLAQAAYPLQESALRLRRDILGPDHPATLESTSSMGSLLVSLGRAAEAEAYYVDALAGRRRTGGELHRETLSAMGNMTFLLDKLGRVAEAETYARNALQGWRDAKNEDDRGAIIALSNLAWVLTGQDKLAEAETYIREAVERATRVLGDDDEDTIQARSNLGRLLFDRGDFAGAEAAFRSVLAGTRALKGETHPRTLDAMSNVGAVLRAQRKLDEAERCLTESLEQSRRILGEKHQDTLISHNELGSLLREQGKHTEAERHFRKAWSNGPAAFGELHPITLVFAINLSSELLTLDRRPDAREVLETVRVAADASGADVGSPRLAQILMLLARTQLGPGHTATDLRDAEAILLRVHAALVASSEASTERTRQCVDLLIDVYEAWHTLEPERGHDESARAWIARKDAAH